VLLTGGTAPRHKVICLSFGDGPQPTAAVKCARIAAADRSLAREANALVELEKRHPGANLAPRVQAEGRRVGRQLVAQSVVPGQPPDLPLTQPGFAWLAPRVTDRLVELTSPGAQPDPGWRQRLVEEPLGRFEQRFGAQLAAGAHEQAHRQLAGLPELPVVWEHRDCGVWNVHVAPPATIAFVDWGDSEPTGLPALDLAYFLATSSFMIDAIEMSDPQAVLASHERLLDPTSPRGEVAAACVGDYCERLGLDPELFPLLRLRSWIVKADPKDPAATSFARLAAAEIHRLDRSGERR
jgi:hypothetical protein